MAYLTAKSCKVLPEARASCSQRGRLPMPPQVPPLSLRNFTTPAGLPALLFFLAAGLDLAPLLGWLPRPRSALLRL